MLYRTILGELSEEIIVNKSRFIAYIRPITTEDEAVEFIDFIKKKHWDATHNVPIFVLGENYTTQRYSDDGEPSGTAGIPVLEMLKKEKITNVVIVITRYFGGVKLGTGGLVRAYTASAKSVLDKGLVDVEEYILTSIKCSYVLHGKIQNFIMNGEYLVEDTKFQENVEMFVYCRTLEFEMFNKNIVEISNGQIEVDQINKELLAVNNDGYIIVKGI